MGWIWIAVFIIFTPVGLIAKEGGHERIGNFILYSILIIMGWQAYEGKGGGDINAAMAFACGFGMVFVAIGYTDSLREYNRKFHRDWTKITKQEFFIRLRQYYIFVALIGIFAVLLSVVF